ncbi:hypothetical protein JOD63_001283 [Microbacterium terrae]|uniref:Uncharacterized protein n=1 Tax=Microbacterium terrae TaxID=69369 RepID=A0A0M2H2P9_9MICO|nr:hypothetical protein [Microbacterium terrae]KJL37906.1 hypothetical protein RS81_02898 [Microbacterium terrae]MBP1077315.1 hypothetical protein [Microbacterium terrae]GLJ98926.1 hypothetical protein GCM10017594_21230 [Microbacterium terrae]
MDERSDLLHGVYRPVRRIVAGEAPWPGLLVWLPSGGGRILVDCGVLPPGWPGWDAAPGGHLLSADDVSREGTGHCAVMSVCVERVSDFLERRRRARVSLTDGEAVTLAISMVRAVDDCRGIENPHGQWWLTDDGRPVFALGAGDAPLRDACVSLTAAGEGGGVVARVWDVVRSLLSEPRLADADLDAAEAEIFALCEPAQLATIVPGSPVPASDHANSRGAVVEDTAPDTLMARLLRHVDADLADAVSKAMHDAWRRLRRTRAPRRAPLMLGAAAAAVVLVGGLLWPTGDGSTDTEAVAASAGNAAGSTTTPTAMPSSDRNADTDSSGASGADSAGDGARSSDARDQGTESDDGGATDDAVGAAEELLDRHRECTDSGCVAALLARPDAVIAPGAIDLPAEELSLTLLDDLGGVIVLRATPADGDLTDQIVVIERRDAEWLLRDVYDIAQQP